MNLTARNEAALRYQEVVKMTACSVRREIGERLGVSETMVSILHRRALAAMRKAAGVRP